MNMDFDVPRTYLDNARIYEAWRAAYTDDRTFVRSRDVEAIWLNHRAASELRHYGGSDAHPVPADYDGDGRADVSVKVDDGRWLIDYAAGGFGNWNRPNPDRVRS